VTDSTERESWSSVNNCKQMITAAHTSVSLSLFQAALLEELKNKKMHPNLNN